MSIDWSKAPEATTGAMQADFKHSEGGFGHVEFLPSHRCRNEYAEGPGAWIYHEKPKPWDGEGLPPVGTVCEVPDGPDYRPATIIAHYKEMAVFAFDDEDGHPYVETCLPLECRPVRTAEQIAADERLHQVRNALSAIHAGQLFPNDFVRGNIVAATVEAMIDAGYRKQEDVQ
jgi:hypothetical protein